MRWPDWDRIIRLTTNRLLEPRRAWKSKTVEMSAVKFVSWVSSTNMLGLSGFDNMIISIRSVEVHHTSWDNHSVTGKIDQVRAVKQGEALKKTSYEHMMFSFYRARHCAGSTWLFSTEQVRTEENEYGTGMGWLVNKNSNSNFRYPTEYDLIPNWPAYILETTFSIL